MAELVVVGLNHRTAPVQVRERFALGPDQVAGVLHAARQQPALEEALILSTCNRTELYAVPAPAGGDPVACFLALVARVKGAAADADRTFFYRHDGLAAARHLFRVAASLDSQIVGEHQILGQVKDAYRLAVGARTAGFLLNKLLHWAFRVGKRVQAETELCRGSVGIAPAAAELAGQIFESLAGRTVLLVGAGQTAEAAAKALLARGAARLIVANRTLYRAQQLASDLLRAPAAASADEGCEAVAGDRAAGGGPSGPAPGPATQDAADAAERLAAGFSDAAASTCGDPRAPEGAGHAGPAQAVPLEDLPHVLPLADLVITSTGSPEPVLTYGSAADVLRRRRRPLVIVDIAVPRDVDERLGDLENVFLYNIDDLNQLVARNVQRRRQEIPRAEAIVEDELARFAEWLASLQVAPTIRLLGEFLESLRLAHLERYGGQFSGADRQLLGQFTETFCSRILSRPAEFLRSLARDGGTGEALRTAELLRRMFGLDQNGRGSSGTGQNQQ